jgi:curved DNA-binding protein CbpA
MFMTCWFACPLPPAALFHEINRAYELLSNTTERAAFDLQRNARIAREERFRKLDSEKQKQRQGAEPGLTGLRLGGRSVSLATTWGAVVMCAIVCERACFLRWASTLCPPDSACVLA